MGGPNAICKQDKAFMPPSGTTAGTASDAYRQAALRLRGPTDNETPAQTQAVRQTQ